MNFIKNIIEPKRLLLTWQPDQASDKSRKRRVIAELTKTQEDEIEFNYLTDTEDFEKAVQLGLREYPHFFPGKDYPKKDIPAFIINFLRRIPSRKRSDFKLFLKSIRIDPNVEVSDFALLGYSGALLPSDSFSLIHPFDNINRPCELLIEATGFRYHEGMNMDLNIGDSVRLLFEPENSVDSRAIKIECDGKIIGYVNRMLLDAFHEWLNNWKISAEIEKIIRRGIKPKVMIFVRIEKK